MVLVQWESLIYDMSTRFVRELHRDMEVGMEIMHAVQDLEQCHSGWSQGMC
jgi:hypothetical protein